MTIRIEHQLKSDQIDNPDLLPGVIKPQAHWNNDPHMLRGMLSVYEWAPKVTPVDNAWRSLAHSPSLGKFVAVSSDGSGNQVMTSLDGETWVIGVTPTPAKVWIKVIRVESLGLFVAVAENGVMTSPDGDTWTLRTPASISGWHDVVWASGMNGGNGLLVAVAWSGHPNQVMTSPDAINWTLRTTPLNAQWESIGYSVTLNMLVAGADSGTATTRLMRSTDAITWTLCTTPNISTAAYYNILWVTAFGCFIALSRTVTSAVALISTDGVNWTVTAGGYGSQWNCMAYSPELELVVAISSTGRIMCNETGPVWQMVCYAENLTWNDVIWVPSQHRFVAVALTGFGARVMTTVAMLPQVP